MKLIWLEHEVELNKPFCLSTDHARHLRDALRVKVGHTFKARSLMHQQMLIYLQITHISKQQVEVIPYSIEPYAIEGAALELIQGYPKASKFDDVLRMAIEAGAAGVLPVMSDYGNVKESAGSNKLERWRRIAREAIEQSGNLEYNGVESIQRLSDLLTLPTVPNMLEVVCHPPQLVGAEHLDLWKVSQAVLLNANRVRIFVGPEGGFSTAELASFVQRKALFYRFGSTILRTEHAGLYALATIRTLMQYKGV